MVKRRKRRYLVLTSSSPARLSEFGSRAGQSRTDHADSRPHHVCCLERPCHPFLGSTTLVDAAPKLKRGQGGRTASPTLTLLFCSLTLPQHHTTQLITQNQLTNRQDAEPPTHRRLPPPRPHRLLPLLRPDRYRHQRPKDHSQGVL